MNILLAMIPSFFWGTTYAVTQFSLSDWPPFLLGVLRALPAGLLLLMIKPTLPSKGEWKVLLTLGTINIAAFFALIFVMALTLPSAISGVGMVSVPVFAILFHWIKNKQKPSVAQAFSGAALILLAWKLFDPSSISLSPLGLAAMIGAITCIIVGSSITQSLGTQMHWWKILTWQLLLGGMVLSIVAGGHALVEPEKYANAVNHFSIQNALGLSWVAVLNTALGYALYVWLLQRMSIVDFAFGGIANPVAGIVSGLLLLGENFTLTQYSLMAGMILMSLLPQVLVAIKKSRVKPVLNSTP
ncbi:DMT family transporter [Vibrio japonicus]|uniref:DMT family transporter n=1 Tax=Vibrio japonicus TaxID=1824638 RepID=A0ABY5LLB7_9VIBR|nr:DMT family transporter [Vibrio japonicus]UUM31930.1 DMT family transporter [Vibrio japonicus]